MHSTTCTDSTTSTPAAGLCNVLVHRYVDIDVDLVTHAVADILDLMPRYVDEVATFLRSTLG